jgi:hypothetical protein
MERLIKTLGYYAGIFDVASPANSLGRFDEYMRSAQAQAEADGQAWATLYYFNQHWIDAAARGEILAWTLVFDGVFKVAVDVLPSHSPFIVTDEQASAFLGGQAHPLACPSGRLIVASLSDRGQTDVAPVVVVEPGTYRVALTVDAEQEDKHSFLEDLADYPSTDGPDWSIQIQQV